MMNAQDLTRGAAVAAAAIALLAGAGCGSSEEKPAAKVDAIKCLGANECKGMSECAGGPSMSSCKALNECKGMGWIYTPTAAICESKGGEPQSS